MAEIFSMEFSFVGIVFMRKIAGVLWIGHVKLLWVLFL